MQLRPVTLHPLLHPLLHLLLQALRRIALVPLTARLDLTADALILPLPLPGSRLLRDETLACEVAANHLMTASVLILTLQRLAGRKAKTPQPNQHEANSESRGFVCRAPIHSNAALNALRVASA